MSNKILSVEQIDAHIKETSQTAAKVSNKESVQLAFNICHYYSIARPVIMFARGVLFFKPKWQKVISDLVAALDASCAT